MKKCLVLDLDNTLWGGVIGEDGLNGIQIGLNPPGSYFLAFQQAILDLYNRGIILAINSRNNYEEVMNVLKNHPDMVLKEDHFAAVRINWQDKARNMLEIAEELNIGLDSLVFLDDDPLNRNLVSAMVPEVEVPELPKDPKKYVKFLLDLPYFENKVLTDEDKMRGNLYVTERLRKEAEKSFCSKDDYLADLKIEARFFENDDSCISRLSQLTEKTNQFNANKMPMTEEDIKRCLGCKKSRIFYARARDRFGDYGVIAFALIKRQKDEWGIESLLMSCRALGRGIEEAFLSHILSRAGVEDNVGKISIVFKKTDKNKPAEEFISRYFKDNYLQNDRLFRPGWIKYE